MKQIKCPGALWHAGEDGYDESGLSSWEGSGPERGLHSGSEDPGITAQEQSGRCWLFAALNILREKVAEKCHLEQFELSQNYLSFYDKLEKANNFLEW